MFIFSNSVACFVIFFTGVFFFFSFSVFYFHEVRFISFFLLWFTLLMLHEMKVGVGWE